MINLFLCSSTNYLENWWLLNDLIIVRNHGDDDDDDVWDIKRVLESQGNMHNKVEIQSNSELRSLTSSPNRSPGLS
jgi:hypothetical protein